MDEKNKVRATARFLRISPQKARLVAANIKGKNVEEALNILTFTPKKAAGMMKKVLHSAIANAEQVPGIDVDSLYVDNVIVDQGPCWKRIMSRAMGRAYRIVKKTSHITVIVKQS